MDQESPDSSGNDQANEALAEYLVRVEQGESIDTEQYIRDHPEVADVLRAYLADSEAVRQVLEEIFHLQAANVDAGRCSQDEVTSTLKCWQDQLTRLAAQEATGARYAEQRQQVAAWLQAVGQQ